MSESCFLIMKVFLLLLTDEYRVRVLKNIFSTDLALTGLYLLVVKDEELVLNSTGGLFPSRFHCNLNQVKDEELVLNSKIRVQEYILH